MMIFKQEFIEDHLNYNSDTTVMLFSCYLLGAIWLDTLETRGTSFKHWLNPPGDRMDTLLVEMEMWKLRGQSLWMFKCQFLPQQVFLFWNNLIVLYKVWKCTTYTYVSVEAFIFLAKVRRYID